MKKYIVRTQEGTVCYATNSVMKAIGWVLQNCELIDDENGIFALPNGQIIEYVINK